MNGGGGGGGDDGGHMRRMLGPPPNRRKDRDEDLLLFREMHKREKDRVINLLQPVSEEFEANGTGNYPLYRMVSAKKGLGYEFLAEGDKNDYDWLKTPPATPLFPSLEMEANAPEFVVQREIPIIQPLSRFSGNSESTKPSNGISNKSPNPKPKVPLVRSVISSDQRPSFSLLETKNKAIIIQNQKMNQSSVDMMMIRRSSTSSSVATSSAKPAMNQTQKRSHLMNSKNIGIDSKTKPKSSTRGVSPSPSPSPLALVRSTNIPAAPRLISDEAAIPPNLRTDRSCSASRGRRPAGTGNQKPDQLSTKAAAAARRQSCSPSVTRGRKVVEQQQQVVVVVENKVRIPSGTQVLGSRMVDKFMNARKSSTEDRETNPKLRSGSINESSGFGRIMSKTSLDMALKHMDIKRDRPVNFRQVGTTTGKDSATVGSRTPSS